MNMLVSVAVFFLLLANIGLAWLKTGQMSEATRLGFVTGQAMAPFIFTVILLIWPKWRNINSYLKGVLVLSLLFFLSGLANLAKNLPTNTAESSQPAAVAEIEPSPELACLERVVAPINEAIKGFDSILTADEANDVLDRVLEPSLDDCPREFITLFEDWTLAIENFTLPDGEEPEGFEDMEYEARQNLVEYVQDYAASLNQGG